MKHKLVAATLLCGILLSGCAKDGEDGAQGPAGNANVRSATFTVSPGDWGPVGTSGQVGYGFAVNYDLSIVTEAISNSGAVLVYLKAGDDRWAALPLTVPEGTTWNKTWLFSSGPGDVQIEVYDDDQLTAPPTQVHEFKVVAIANSGLIVSGEVDVENYESVRDYFNLEN